MTNPSIKNIDAHELKKRINANPDLCLIDVRSQEEWQEMRIAHAIHIPKEQISAEISSVAPNKTKALYLHCKGGVRSLYAAQSLIDAGYQEVYSIDGGIIEWAISGYPVVYS